MSSAALSLVALMLLPALIKPLPTGAPRNACKSMKPGHGFEPQEGQSPVTLEVDSSVDSNNSTIALILHGQVFKGFLIEARESSASTQAIGTFVPSPQSNGTAHLKVMECGSFLDGVAHTHNAVTHTSPVPKKEIRVLWKPPKGFEGKPVFFYTVVVEFTTYWVAQQLDIEKASA